MPRYLRRREERFTAYRVENAEGYKVGVFNDASRYVTPGHGPWEWNINGEIAAPLVSKSGLAATLDETKTALAANWRRWLMLKGLPEQSSCGPPTADLHRRCGGLQMRTRR